MCTTSRLQQKQEDEEDFQECSDDPGTQTRLIFVDAGVHDIHTAANAFRESTLSPTVINNHDALSSAYVRLREMQAAKQAFTQLGRDWSLAVSQPRSVGELLLKVSLQ